MIFVLIFMDCCYVYLSLCYDHIFYFYFLFHEILFGLDFFIFYEDYDFNTFEMILIFY